MSLPLRGLSVTQQARRRLEHRNITADGRLEPHGQRICDEGVADRYF